MKLIKPIFITFISTFIFLLFFQGVYLLFKINYGGPEESYSWIGGKRPSDFVILFGAFRSVKLITEVLLVSLLFTFILNWAVGKMITKAVWLFYLTITLLSTFLIGVIYSIYKLCYTIGYDKDYFEFYFNELWNEISCMLILYFIFIAPANAFLSKRFSNNKLASI